MSIDVKYLTSFAVEMRRYLEPTHWCHRIPGDIFYDLAPHLTMLLLDFLEDVCNVKVITKKLSGNLNIHADELKVIVEAKNGVGSLAISFNSPARCVTIDIVRTKGRLSINADNQIVIRHKPLRSQDLANPILKGVRTLGDVCQQITGLSSNAFFSILGKYRNDYTQSHRYLIGESLKVFKEKGRIPSIYGNAEKLFGC